VEGNGTHQRLLGCVDVVLMGIVGRPKSAIVGTPKGSVSQSGKTNPVLATIANAQGKRTMKSKRKLFKSNKK